MENSLDSFSARSRRAAGRRRYNKLRYALALMRRKKVSKLLWEYRKLGVLRRMSWHGVQARIAFELGVSKSTITRDVQWLEQLREDQNRCPRCGAILSDIAPDATVPRPRRNTLQSALSHKRALS
jgi:hypothetical protein